MIKLLFNLSKLLILSYCSQYNYNKKIIKLIQKYINDCGCICVKCIQWLIPLLEKEKFSSNILKILSNVYENNKYHNIEYTEQLYNKYFHNSIYDDYTIMDIIGSGSIGQVYKLKCKHTKNIHVMKVKHPNIEEQIIKFRKIFKFIYNFDSIKQLFYKYFPFNLIDFLEDFYKQTDFINESNNILNFYHNYNDNPYIIIPKLVKTSNGIIIMEYLEGECIDNLDISEYNKSKIIFLLYLFIRNNMLITNNIHGDLHKYNWKVSSDKINNLNKIIIYDFGYCFKNDKIEYPYIKNICNLIQSYDKNNIEKVNKYKHFLEFLFDKKDIIINIDFNHNITKPDILLNQILTISRSNNLMIKRYKLLNILLLMCLVDNYFTKYNISNEPKIKVKSNLLNAYSFCDHYNIFEKLSNILLKEYYELEPPKELFESIQFGDNIKNLM